MNLRHLVVREILHRKGNFALGLGAVLVAVGCLVGAVLALDGHDLRTKQIIAQKEKQTEELMKRLEDDMRKITKGLGFNVLILPKDQNIGDFFADDFASKYMPEEFARTLAESKDLITVNHLLPSLQQKLKWPETKRTIILIGTRGEVPILHRAPKKPLIETVPAGTVVLGYDLHQSLGLQKGHTIKLLGKEFTVSKLHKERGDKDDITIWMDLAEAQEILDKKGLINAIKALECHCAMADLGKVRGEIQKILPDTQVKEFRSKAIARAEARTKTAEAAKASLAAEKRNRTDLRSEREAFASLLVPLVLLGCCFSVGFLALSNVRDRTTEVGILRALGLRSRNILWVFLGKAAVIGFFGAALGNLAGIAIGIYWGWPDIGLTSENVNSLVDLRLAGTVLLAAPLVAMIATWVPALAAARQDPAVILRNA